MRISDWSSDVCSSDLGLDRIGQMHPPQRQQRVAEDARVAAKGRGRIDVDGRAHLVGDARKRHLFGVERAVDQRKMVHQFSGGRSKGSGARRSEEHTSELQSLMRISYAVFCLKKKKTQKHEGH